MYIVHHILIKDSKVRVEWPHAPLPWCGSSTEIRHAAQSISASSWPVRVGSYVPTWVGCEGGNLGRIFNI